MLKATGGGADYIELDGVTTPQIIDVTVSLPTFIRCSRLDMQFHRRLVVAALLGGSLKKSGTLLCSLILKLSQRMRTSLLVLPVVALAAPPPQDWAHGWDKALDAQFIDYGYEALTAEQASFVATHYAIASFEKCTGPGPTEPNVYATAALVKAANPAAKAMFYWDVDQTALSCYNAHAVFMANPGWWLRDDAGAVVNGSAGQPIMDYENAAARAWWVSVPLNGTGSPAASLIDGVLADGTGRGVAGSGCFTPASRISPARCESLVTAKSQMVWARGARACEREKTMNQCAPPPPSCSGLRAAGPVQRDERRRRAPERPRLLPAALLARRPQPLHAPRRARHPRRALRCLWWGKSGVGEAPPPRHTTHSHPQRMSSPTKPSTRASSPRSSPRSASLPRRESLRHARSRFPAQLPSYAAERSSSSARGLASSSAPSRLTGEESEVLELRVAFRYSTRALVRPRALQLAELAEQLPADEQLGLAGGAPRQAHLRPRRLPRHGDGECLHAVRGA